VDWRQGFSLTSDSSHGRLPVALRQSRSNKAV